MLNSNAMYFLALCGALSVLQNFGSSFQTQRTSSRYSTVINLNRNILETSRNRIISKTVLSSSVTLGDDKASDRGIVQIRNLLNPLYLSMSQPVPSGPHLKIKGKILNIWGLFYALTTFTVALVVLPFMVCLSGICDAIGNGKQRRILDWVIHFWARTALKLSLCQPKVYGLENLPASNETVVYVPNHTSFIDILVMSGFVPRPFKYLSKSEIMDIPVIGWAMKLAKHVFLKRDDIRSTLEVSDRCVERLKDGNSLVLFAEGTRSPDGSLKAFKKGAFQMAKAAGVKIVPVSIGNLHRWMPSSALLPLAPIRHVYVKIHPAIETKDVPLSVVRSLCQEAVNSGLPPYQQQVSL